MNSGGNPFRQLPSVDALLRSCDAEIATWGHSRVTTTLRGLLAELRGAIAGGAAPDLADDALRGLLRARLEAGESAALAPLLNLTGTVLHTNLGRAPLPPEALAAVVAVSTGASNLEYDLDSGGRGERETHVEALVCELTGAEAATAVNNNAAAVLLTLNTLALGREVPVSRGELVEIGGSFRIPDVMARSGARLVEIGATNRTHLKDYRNAIGADTALLMKVHTSNYEVRGFTRAVTEAELAALAQEHALPLVVDLGSGNLADFAALGLPQEPTVSAVLDAGADLVTFSGDKLLGGPQAGIIAGRADLVEAVRRNPLKRALRLDKMTLAALAEILKLYRDPDSVARRLPTLRLLTRAREDIERQAQALLPPVRAALGTDWQVDIAECHSQIGSGSLPVDTLPSAALRCTPAPDSGADPAALAAILRSGPLPVIGRIHRNALWLDLRCLEEDQEAAFTAQFGILSP